MEYLTPITIRFIRCKNNRRLLISFRHQLEKTMSTFTIKRQISHLIDYQQFVLAQNLEFILKYSFAVCLFQSYNEYSCIGKIHRKTRLDSFNTKSNCQMRFPHTRRAKENHIFGIIDKSQQSKVADNCFINRRLKLKIKIFKSLIHRKSRTFHLRFL